MYLEESDDSQCVSLHVHGKNELIEFHLILYDLQIITDVSLYAFP